MAQPRLVLVDDTDPSIQYSGPWFEVQHTEGNLGDFGPPFENTLHGVNVNATFSYSFSGSLITVMGTSITTNASGTQDPTWECFVDNISIGWKTVLSEYPENNWIFCQNTQLKDGPHVLTVKATVSNQQTFWFDQIQYLPSSDVSLSQATLRIDPTDPAIQYSDGWSELNGIAEMTQTTGSTITFVFSGVSLSFIGYQPPNFPLTASSAIYSIDGQTPINFFVPSGAEELYNQVFFQTGQLSAGQHKLVVTHQGNSATSPLALNYFVVQGGSSSASSASSSPGSTIIAANSASLMATGTISGSASLDTSIATGISATGTSSITSSSGVSSSSNGSSSSMIGSSATSKSSRSLGGIIGGILGVLILLSFFLALVFCYRKRKNKGAWRRKKLHPFDVLPTQSWPGQDRRSKSQSQLLSLTGSKLARERSANGMNLSGGTALTSPTFSSGDELPALDRLQFGSIIPVVAQTSPMTTSPSKGGQRIMQPPVSPQDDDDPAYRTQRAQDSGLRMELPPLYTPG